MRGQFISSWSLWLGALWLAFPLAARATGVEKRTFVILVDGRLAGECRLTYSAGEEGSETRSGSAAVQVRHLLGSYRYHFDGTEVWKGGRLQRLHSISDDDGKKCTIDAVAGETGLRVQANGQTSTVRADAWPTTYWRMPAAELRGQPLTLLDIDTGRTLAARFKTIGPARLIVFGQAIDCTHYRVTGQTEADLWYDAQERPVRQETVEDGHRTILILKEVRHP